MKEKFELSLETPSTDWLSRSHEALAHPADVLSNPHMSKAEKRALLASWASDVRAVKDAPTYRQLDSGALVEVSDIIQALCSLDTGPSASRTPYMARPLPYFVRRPYTLIARWRHKNGRRNGSDDDNNPPPCPAAAVPIERKAAATDSVWQARPEWA